MKRRGLILVSAGLLALFFIGGVYRLFALRFGAGDVYPAGSSRRADPLGTRVYFESLGRLAGLRVERAYEPPHRLGSAAGTTLFVLGLDPGVLSDATDPFAGELDRFAHAGGRIVVGLAHASAFSRPGPTFVIPTAGPRRKSAGPAAGPAPIQPRSLLEAWGISLGAATNAAATNGLNSGLIPSLPAHIPWHGTRQLRDLRPGWLIVYALDGEPVIAQRPVGEGSVVLLASDYALSNEALRHERLPGLLAWLPGGATRVVFDETHLGLTLTPGLAGLIGRYRLHGAVAGLLVLAALYVWQQLARFNPPPAGTDDPDVLPGRDLSSGFLNLLRRSVPVADLIAICAAEWRRSAARPSRLPATRLADIQDEINLEAARPPRERRPVETYRRIVALLHPPRHTAAAPLAPSTTPVRKRPPLS